MRRMGWDNSSDSDLSSFLAPSWHRCRGEILARFGIPAYSEKAARLDKAPVPDEWGDSNLYVPPPDKQSAAKLLEMAKGAYFEGLQAFSIDSTVRIFLMEITTACRARGVPVLFFVMPESQEFRSWYGANTALALDDLLGMLAQDCGASCVNLNTWLPERD